MLVVKCNSHRARDKFNSRLGLDLLGYYISYSVKKYHNSRGIYIITEEEFEKVKNIKGLSKIKISPKDLGICWSDSKDNGDARIRLEKLEAEKLIKI